MSIVSSPAILLRGYPYSETSRILRFLTPDLGVVSVMARGVRSRTSKGQGGMETFDEGVLVFTHRADRELHSLRDFQRSGGRRPLGSDLRRFAGASLLAEILLAHSLEEGDPELFEWVSRSLRTLASAPEAEVSGHLLSAVWRTLVFLGFTPSLDQCVRCGAEIHFPDSISADEGLPRFDVSGGGLRCVACAEHAQGVRMGPGAVDHLRGLLMGEPPHPLPGARTHLRILEGFSHHHLAGRKAFHSFELLTPFFLEGEVAGG